MHKFVWSLVQYILSSGRNLGCLSLISVLFIVSCQSGEQGSFSPKPRMYPRVVLPDPAYQLVDPEWDCGFVFKKSTHAEIIERNTFFNEAIPFECWFDLHYASLDASIHFTYYPIGDDYSYQNLANESFKMVYEHSAIASGIDESPIVLDGRESGMEFNLAGPVASPYQFFLTDTADHFLRGAVYFNAQPNPDSIAPILDYIMTDIDTLLKSFRWK